jgi:hypothetical protein
MTSKVTNHASPYALISSTLGTVLVSMTAVWLVTSAYQPVTVPDATSAPHSSSWPHPLYRLSPIPPGADWTS